MSDLKLSDEKVLQIKELMEQGMLALVVASQMVSSAPFADNLLTSRQHLESLQGEMLYIIKKRELDESNS